MEVERLIESEVRAYGNEQLVGAFELSSRQLFSRNDIGLDIETRQKNHHLLTQEIYRRMGD